MSLLKYLSRLYPRDRLTTILAKPTVTPSIAYNFQTSAILYAEPLKKKRKIDPQVIKQREERRRKKLEKQIRRLEKNARQLKPIDELEVPLTLIDEREKRTRPAVVLTAETIEYRAILKKKWAHHKLQEKLADIQLIDKVLMAQEKALQELKFESEILYEAACKPDIGLLPFKADGPLSTPPIENYDSPDGEYLDISKKWE